MIEEAGRGQTDDYGDTRAEDDAAEDVSAELVDAHGMLPRSMPLNLSPTPISLNPYGAMNSEKMAQGEEDEGNDGAEGAEGLLPDQTHEEVGESVPTLRLVDHPYRCVSHPVLPLLDGENDIKNPPRTPESSRGVGRLFSEA